MMVSIYWSIFSDRLFLAILVLCLRIVANCEWDRSILEFSLFFYMCPLWSTLWTTTGQSKGLLINAPPEELSGLIKWFISGARWWAILFQQQGGSLLLFNFLCPYLLLWHVSLWQTINFVFIEEIAMSYYLFIEFTIIRYRFINTSVSPLIRSPRLEPQQCSSGLSFNVFAVVVFQEILDDSRCSSLQHEFNLCLDLTTSHVLLGMDNKKKVDKYCKSSFDHIPGPTLIIPILL